MHTSGLKKLIIKHSGVTPVKIKKGPKWDYAFVTFKSDADRDTACEALHNLPHQRGTLDVSPADARRDPMTDPDARKRRRVDGKGEDGASADGSAGVPLDTLPEEELASRLCDKATPLHAVPYPDQLRQKKEEVKKKLKEIFRDNGVRDLPWVREGAKAMHGLPCQLDEVTPSPETEGYRNKVEFTVGPGRGGLAAVGHLLGSYTEGMLIVVPPTSCRHIPPLSKELATWFNEFIQEVRGGGVVVVCVLSGRDVVGGWWLVVGGWCWCWC
jgi:tRNA (uracil-5-)-methyltransferase